MSHEQKIIALLDKIEREKSKSGRGLVGREVGAGFFEDVKNVAHLIFNPLHGFMTLYKEKREREKMEKGKRGRGRSLMGGADREVPEIEYDDDEDMGEDPRNLPEYREPEPEPVPIPDPESDDDDDDDDDDDGDENEDDENEALDLRISTLMRHNEAQLQETEDVTDEDAQDIISAELTQAGLNFYSVDREELIQVRLWLFNNLSPAHQAEALAEDFEDGAGDLWGGKKFVNTIIEDSDIPEDEDGNLISLGGGHTGIDDDEQFEMKKIDSDYPNQRKINIEPVIDGFRRDAPTLTTFVTDNNVIYIALIHYGKMKGQGIGTYLFNIYFEYLRIQHILNSIETIELMFSPINADAPGVLLTVMKFYLRIFGERGFSPRTQMPLHTDEQILRYANYSYRVAHKSYWDRDVNGNGFFSTIRDKVAHIFGPSNKYNNISTKTLKEYGGMKIKDLVATREVLNQGVRLAMNIVSSGSFDKQTQKLGYDDLFHIRLFARMEDGTLLLIEKNEVIYIKPTDKIRGEALPIKYKEGSLTLQQLMDAGQKFLGKGFFLYDAFTNNCASFVVGILKGNNLWSADDTAFLAQDVSSLKATLPKTSVVSNFVTSLGAIVSRIQGKGKRKSPYGDMEQPF